jgi:hypothetical protein
MLSAGGDVGRPIGGVGAGAEEGTSMCPRREKEVVQLEEPCCS